MLRQIHILLLTLFVVFGSIPAHGQSIQTRKMQRSFNQILKKIDRVPTFNPEELEGVKFIRAPMDFAHDEMETQLLKDELLKHNIIGVTYIFTQFKSTPSFDQRQLNLNRMRRLYDVASYLFTDERIHWNVLEQVAPKSRDEASAQYHGFILFYEDMSRYATFAEVRNQLDSINIVNYRPKSKEDTLVQTIFERNEDWKRMNVICDLTGSMSPYTAQLLMWFKANLDNKRIINFVFFNDGDDLMNSRKRPNRTGGIYTVVPSDMDELLRVVEECMLGGAGGDLMENDIEALLRGIESCRHCAEVILIADNLSPMRDYGLMNRIRRPVRVVLCGTQLGINTQYLDLARETRGSIHTIDQDIFDLDDLRNGDQITINGDTYELKRGKFKEI